MILKIISKTLINMYKMCSLWILLLTLSTCLSEDLELLDSPCERMNLRGHCKLILSCKFPSHVKNMYNDTQIETLFLCGRINIIPVVCCPDGMPMEETPDPDSLIHFEQDEITTFLPPRSTTTTLKRPSVSPTPTILPSRNVCGKQAIEDRIVGGEIASLYDFPWIVQLNFSDIGYACAGTLVTNRHVITAAHCVTSEQKLISVRLGEWDSKISADCSDNTCSDPPEDRKVLQTIVHPYFNLRGDPTHDIAILVLDEQVNFTDFIKPVCLPTTEYVAGQDYTNDNSYMTAGWGITEYKIKSTKKRKLSINAVSYDICRAALNLGRDSRDPFIICAGGVKNKDTCQGDSGGPLIGQVVEEHEVNWYLFGITSMGSKYCGRQGTPGVYTRVSKYMPWIENQLSR
ncbi:CLIP domain-containing serine protease 14D [Pieris rapae]|uniref:CLIP domain-containing serine protease 14D n=1 Tax=Pieris rapae TaxID=64459 RepID=UPI001E27D6A7|nr:CLIP domain-containing serine protease 14D [Pieris rapae]